MAGYYGKRPMWQWIVLYAIVGAVIYYLVYYFVLAPKGASQSGGYNYSNTSTQSGQQSSPSGSMYGQ